MKRKVLVMLEVDESRFADAGIGTIDYVEMTISTLNGSGVNMTDARILDNDDPEDKAYIDIADKIFCGESL